MLGLAMVIAAIFSVAGLILGQVTTKGNEGRTADFGATAVAAGATFVLLTLGNWFWFYVGTPAFTGLSLGWIVCFNLIGALACFGGIDLLFERISAASVIAGALVMFLLVGVMGFWNQWPLGQDNADILARSVHVEHQETDAYPNTSDEHIVLVGEQAARFKAGQGMAENGLGSRFSLRGGVLQSVQGHMYYVFEIRPTDHPTATQSNYVVPGYVVVDAEDPRAPVQQKMGYQIHWVKGGFWYMDLERYAYDQGIRSAYMDHWTLEVDDDWRPYYTASLNQPLVRWQDAVPTEFVVLDPQTGQITRHALDRIPAWADRVYSADVAKRMMDWWGHWGQAEWAWFREGNTNRFKPDDTTPNLVYTADGPAWQILMTSYASDTSVNYVALFSTRSNHVRLYKAPQGLSLEKTVDQAYEGSTENLKKLEPTGLALHKIYGQLTWVASMVAAEGKDAEDGGFAKAMPFAGVGLVRATSTDAAGVRIGNDKGQVLDHMRRLATTGTDNKAPEEGGQNQSIQGTVTQADRVVFGGNTVLVIALAEDNDHIYRVEVKDNDLDGLRSVFVRTGDRVTISFLNTGGPVRSASRLTITAASPPLASATPAS